MYLKLREKKIEKKDKNVCAHSVRWKKQHGKTSIRIRVRVPRSLAATSRIPLDPFTVSAELFKSVVSAFMLIGELPSRAAFAAIFSRSMYLCSRSPFDSSLSYANFDVVVALHERERDLHPCGMHIFAICKSFSFAADAGRICIIETTDGRKGRRFHVSTRSTFSRNSSQGRSKTRENK